MKINGENMSEWSDRITSHAIWEEMNLLGIILDTAAAKENTTTSIWEDIERARTVLSYCGKKLASSDPILLLPSNLSAIHNSFNLMRTEIEAYISDENINHFTTVNLRVDELLTQLRNIPTPPNDELTFISESISSFRSSLGKQLNDVIEEQKLVRAKLKSNSELLAKQENAIVEEQQKLAVLGLELQTQFSTAQDKRATDFATTLADLNTKVSSTISENQTQFSNTQISNQEKFSSVINDAAISFNDALSELNNLQELAEKNFDRDLVRLKNNYEKTAKNLLNEITNHKKQVELLVGVIGNLGVTSGYLKAANHARNAVYIWQFLTVASLAGLIAVAYKMAFPPVLQSAIEQAAAIAVQPEIHSNSSFYQGLAVRVFLSITFGIFAAYSAKQADKQQRIESKNRKLALELEALGAFISPLPVDMQHKFRADLGERSFGIPDNELSQIQVSDPVSVIDLIKSKEFDEVASRFIKFFKNN